MPAEWPTVGFEEPRKPKHRLRTPDVWLWVRVVAFLGLVLLMAASAGLVVAVLTVGSLP